MNGRLAPCEHCNEPASRRYDLCRCGAIVCPACVRDGKHLIDGVHWLEHGPHAKRFIALVEPGATAAIEALRAIAG